MRRRKNRVAGRWFTLPLFETSTVGRFVGQAFHGRAKRTMQGTDTNRSVSMLHRERHDRGQPGSDASRTGPDGSPTATELLVVDPGVDSVSILLSGLRDEVEVLHLAPDGCGFEQIAAFLADRRGLDALHVVSHGEPGCLLLAGGRVDLHEIAVRDRVLADIAGALAPGAQVVLYACSVGGGRSGNQFVEYLEIALGAAVAAATGPVGAGARGGSWDLRDRRGVPARPAFTPAACADYPGLLAVRHDAIPSAGSAPLHCRRSSRKGST